MTADKKLILLLPSHGIEDLPDSPEEAEAEELLAVFACLAHPSAVSRVGRPPSWDRADMPPTVGDGDVILIPSGCESWMEPTWPAEAEDRGAHVVSGHQTFSDWFSAVTAAYGDDVWSETVAEAFGSVGLFRLFLERFARRMHDFDGVDESRLLDGLRNAAKNLLHSSDGDDSDADEAGSEVEVEPASAPSPTDLVRLLGPCWDVLLEYRERIHPLDPALLEVLLLEPEQADDLATLLGASPSDDDPPGDSRCVDEPVASVIPLNLMADRPCWEKILDERPGLQDRVRDAWADRQCELLIGEDESFETRLEPTERIGEHLWSVVDWTRETFGRRPRVWARRDYGLHPDMPMLLKSCGYEGALHLTFDVGQFPELEEAKLTWQAADRTGIEAFSRLPLPAARAATFWQFPERLGESVEFDAAAAVMLIRWADSDPWWYRSFRFAAGATPVFGSYKTVGDFLADSEGHGAVLSPKAREYGSATLAKRAAKRTADPLSTERERWTTYVRESFASVAAGLRDLVLKGDGSGLSGAAAESLAMAVAGSGEATGHLVLNPTPRPRVALVSSPKGSRRVEAPPYGYAWVADDEPATGGRPLVDELTLQNEFFAVQIHEGTGGIKRIWQHNRRGNLLSEHVARRFGDGDDDYDVARASSVRVVEQTPSAATIESISSWGEDGETTITQRFRVVRGRPWLSINVLIDGPEPADGNPWFLYDAVRFAWASEAAAVSQSCDLTPSVASRDRLESPMFVEIDEEPVVTIATHGSTFHRRDYRKLDCLVSIHREQKRSAMFAIAIGERNPGAIALSSMLADDAFIVPTAKPRLPKAWLVSFDQSGVVILSIESSRGDDDEPRYRLRIRETNGTAGVVTMRLCRPAAEAFASDFAGRLTDRLMIRDGSVEVRLREFQMRDVLVKLA